jgi:mevalonate kinase
MSSASQHEGRACGKVILFGEHAVVYGVPAIAVGIDRGAVAVASRLAEGPSELRVDGKPNWGVCVTDEASDADESLGLAFRAVLDATPGARPASVRVRAELPPGGGLGCSAAVGVAVARALDPGLRDADLAERAMAWERVFHGNPSGVDAAVAASGGSVFFKRGASPERIRVGVTFMLCVGHTGIASSTKSMVDAVAAMRAKKPAVVEKCFDGIASLVRNARLAIEAGDQSAVGRLMDLNQMLLSGLFVSTPEIERMCELARGAGAEGAKLTGAGGGGSVVALASSPAAADAVLAAWRADGYEGFVTNVRASVNDHPGALEEASP